MEGNLEEHHVHGSVLAEMVRLRSGLNALGCEVLQMFLS